MPLPSDDGPPLLGPGGQALLEECLRALPAERVGRALVESIDLEDGLDDDLAAVRLLGELGDLRSFGALLGVTSRAEPRAVQRPRLQQTLQASLSRVMERDERAVELLRVHLGRVDGPLLLPVARALAERGGDATLPALLDLLGRDSELDAVVLCGLGRAGARELARDDGLRVGILRDHLEAAAPAVRVQAAASLADLHDSASFERLIELLGDRDRAVRAAALRGLRALSGQRWPADPERWTAWAREELLWLDRWAPLLARSAREDEAGPAVRAVRDLSSHPLLRGEVLPHLAAGLGHPDEAVVLATLAAFARLGEPRAVPLLVEGLEAPRRSVREATLETLQALTGERERRTVEDWSAWLAD